MPARTQPHPFARPWRHMAGHRRDVVVASLFSVANKIFDLARRC